jgi:hypothetical protein
MNPVEYTLAWQRLLVILAGVSFLIGAAIVALLDPTVNFGFVYLFLAVLFVFLASILILTAFWWFFSIRKEILTIDQVNKLIGQGIISSAFIILFLVMQQTRTLNLLTGSIMLLVYILYQIWANSEPEN